MHILALTFLGTLAVAAQNSSTSIAPLVGNDEIVDIPSPDGWKDSDPQMTEEGFVIEKRPANENEGNWSKVIHVGVFKNLGIEQLHTGLEKAATSVCTSHTITYEKRLTGSIQNRIECIHESGEAETIFSKLLAGRRDAYVVEVYVRGAPKEADVRWAEETLSHVALTPLAP